MKYIGNNVFVKPSLCEQIQVNDVVAAYVEAHDWKIAVVIDIIKSHTSNPVHNCVYSHYEAIANKSGLSYSKTTDFAVQEEELTFICKDVVSGVIYKNGEYHVNKITNYKS